MSTIKRKIAMWTMRCATCTRPWLSTHERLGWPCPFCGSDIVVIEKHR